MTEPEIGPNGLPLAPRAAPIKEPGSLIGARSRRPHRLGPSLSAMGLGLASALLLGPLTGLPAMVLGVVGFRRAKPGTEARTTAMTGVVLGLAGSVWWTFAVIAIFT